MSDFNLQTQFNALPADLKKEAEHFIEFLSTKTKKLKKKKHKKRKFGIAKGMFVMLPGFDDPLEDFKEYM